MNGAFSYLHLLHIFIWGEKLLFACHAEINAQARSQHTHTHPRRPQRSVYELVKRKTPTYLFKIRHVHNHNLVYIHAEDAAVRK